MIGAAADLNEVLERHRSGRPDRLALADAATTLTWEELGSAVASVAKPLISWRVEPGATVVLALSSSPHWVLAFLASRRAGLTVASAGAPRRRTDLRALCFETEAVGIVGDGPASGVQRAVAAQLGIGYVDVSDPSAVLLPTRSGSESPRHATGVAALHFTSGSTGDREAVPRSELSLLNEGGAIADALETPGPMQIVSPVFHSFGAGMLSAALLAGRPALLTPRYTISGVLESVSRHRAAVLVGVPYVFQCLTRFALSTRHETGSLRLGVAGGTALHEEVVTRFRERFAATLAQEYGLSEVGVVSLNLDDPEGRPWSVGRALAGLEVTAARGDDRRDGELVVRRARDRDSSIQPVEAVRTGDCGRVDADGFIRITGRSKHMINVGGVKVAPHEVERRLLAGCDLDDIAVIAVPDPVLGERVGAAVVPRADAAPATADFHARCRRALDPHEIPRRVLWLDALPRLESGKPDLQTIRRRLASATR